MSGKPWLPCRFEPAGGWMSGKPCRFEPAGGWMSGKTLASPVFAPEPSNLSLGVSRFPVSCVSSSTVHLRPLLRRSS
jgi:hypothetical protein